MDLNEHVATIHEGKKPFECKLRDTKYKYTYVVSVTLLQFMKKRNHLNSKYANSSLSKIPIKYIHEGKKPLKCSLS